MNHKSHYDAGVLIAAGRNSRTVWAEHRARLELGIVPITTAPVVAQVSRSATQAPLHRLLKGCLTVGFEPTDAHAVGELCGKARSSDVVDAHLVHVASTGGSSIVTSDPADLSRIAAHTAEPVRVIEI